MICWHLNKPLTSRTLSRFVNQLCSLDDNDAAGTSESEIRVAGVGMVLQQGGWRDRRSKGHALLV